MCALCGYISFSYRKVTASFVRLRLTLRTLHSLLCSCAVEISKKPAARDVRRAKPPHQILCLRRCCKNFSTRGILRLTPTPHMRSCSTEFKIYVYARRIEDKAIYIYIYITTFTCACTRCCSYELNFLRVETVFLGLVGSFTCFCLSREQWCVVRELCELYAEDYTRFSLPKCRFFF